MMKTSTRQFLATLFMSSLILTGLFNGIAYSKSGNDYQLTRSTLNAGGNIWTSTNYRMRGSLGQLPQTKISVSKKTISSLEPSPAHSENSTLTPIPEPGTLVLFGVGGFGLLILIRRKTKTE